MTGEGGMWDAPNQQVVRDDCSGPWEEGTGGAPGPVVEEGGGQPGLDDMTKDELIAEASARGIDVPASATKAEIREAIDSG